MQNKHYVSKITETIRKSDLNNLYKIDQNWH